MRIIREKSLAGRRSIGKPRKRRGTISTREPKTENIYFSSFTIVVRLSIYL